MMGYLLDLHLGQYLVLQWVLQLVVMLVLYLGTSLGLLLAHQLELHLVPDCRWVSDLEAHWGWGFQ